MVQVFLGYGNESFVWEGGYIYYVIVQDYCIGIEQINVGGNGLCCVFKQILDERGVFCMDEKIV